MSRHIITSQSATGFYRSLAAAWQPRAHAPRELMNLSDRVLHDIGLSPRGVCITPRTSFWRP